MRKPSAEITDNTVRFPAAPRAFGRRPLSSLTQPLPTCTPADPFLIDHDCTIATGHYPIVSCGAVVCVHCGKVFWQ